MSDPIEGLPIPTAQKPNATQPGGLCAGAEPARQNQAESKPGFLMKPYLLGAVIAVLLAFLVFQQTQISRLSQELQQIDDSVKSSDVRTRLDATDAKLQELDQRLNYLDSKINATDQKAQTSLDKWKAQEDHDFFGNMVKGIKQTLGIH